MSEQEWLDSEQPWPMLVILFGVPADEWYDDGPHFLGTKPQIEGKASLRKLRLFGCACCRQAWNELPSTKNKQAVELAEQYADGLPGAVTGWIKRQWLRFWLHEASSKEIETDPASIGSIQWGPYSLLRDELSRLIEAAGHIERYSMGGDARKQADLFRCIFGNPFRPVIINPAWLTPTVLGLAQAVYDNRNLPSGTLDNARLGVLADALEDAGAGGPILEHLRSEGPHVRGCFAVDLVLGKE